jgi:hypothetical protein
MGNKLEKRANLERLLRAKRDHELDVSRALAAEQVANSTVNVTDLPEDFQVIDCACLIHGNAYSWEYVEKLYSMLCRNLTPKVRLHVYTEKEREVPPHMVKHALEDWPGIAGPRRSWWYKIQMFNSEHHSGPLLYFDLDTVIVGNIDWIWGLPLKFFYGIKDFRSLWRPTDVGINSSIMWWDTTKFNHVWSDFLGKDRNMLVKQYHGDQDFISDTITHLNRRFFDPSRIKSWRWQCLDGGYDFKTRRYRQPMTGTKIDDNLRVLVFHGDPKPLDVTDPVVKHYWT